MGRVAMGMKILIVDDEAAKLKLYAEEFMDEGYEVVTAQDGESALRLFDSQDFDLVTLDITMGTQAEGIGLLRRMKGVKPAVPVIMLTAYDFRDDFQTWAADDYIVKSSDLTELKRRVHELTGG